jgi:uncharacterized protein YggE
LLIIRTAALVATVAILSLALACGASASQSPTLTPSSPAAPSATPEPASDELQPTYPQQRTITVQTTADVLGRELAYLSVGFQVTGPDVPSVLGRAEDVNIAVRRVLDELGFVAEIHDENLSAYPASSNPYYSYPATAYRTISVEMANDDDPSRVMAALDTRIRGGLLTSSESINFSIRYTIEEGGPAESHARTRAIADARTAAEQIALESDLTLGEILSVVEGSDVQLSLSAPSYYGPVPPGAPQPASGTSGIYSGLEPEPRVTITVTFAVK